MASSLDAKLGFWQDHSRRPRDQFQYLETDFWLRWMTAFVAVSLTLIGPCVFKILKSFLLFALGYASWFESRLREYRESTLGEHTPLLSQAPQQNVNATNSRDDSSQQQSLVQDWGLGGLCGEREDHPMSGTQCQSCRLRAQSSAVNGAAGPKHALQNSENSRTTVFKIIQEVEKPSTASIVIIILLFGLAVALAIASAFSAKIASNRIGLSSSKSCGIWQFDDNAGEEPSYQDDINNYRKEARASQYARNCYNSLNTANTLSCKVFYNESIAYSTQTGQRCPFSTPELCAGGLYSAITFNTGLVDASTIGINAASTHKFRRTTTCSPLNMSEPYTQQKFSSRNETSYQYFYGPKDNSEYTFNTSGQPFDWLIPAYSVNTYFSSLYHEEDYWHPIPELGISSNSTMTIMFISSMHIYHIQRSEDLIFPAKTPHSFPGLQDPYYYNADPQARVLACVDESMVCSPDGNTCWSMTSPTPQDAASDPAYWLMKWSLENSDTYDAIKWRLGTALLAQESISQSVSKPLSANQWQLEASALFATSLAMIQYDAWAIATGEDREKPGYLERTPDEARGRLCGRYKFKTEDYTNVNVLAFWGLPALALAIFFLSWDWSTLVYWCSCCFRIKLAEREERQGSEPLVVDAIAIGICKGLFWIWGELRRKAKTICS